MKKVFIEQVMLVTRVANDDNHRCSSCAAYLGGANCAIVNIIRQDVFETPCIPRRGLPLKCREKTINTRFIVVRMHGVPVES